MSDHFSPPCTRTGGAPRAAPRFVLVLLGLLGVVLMPGQGASAVGASGGVSAQRSVVLAVGSAQNVARASARKVTGTDHGSAPQVAAATSHHAQEPAGQASEQAVPLDTVLTAGRYAAAAITTDRSPLFGAASHSTRGRAPPFARGL